MLPVRFHTRGYTGSKEQGDRYDIFELIDNVENMVANMERAAKPEECTGFWYTHFVRGELFVYVDSMVTSYFQEKATANAEATHLELRSAINTCDAYCRLYCSWLVDIKKYFSDVI